MPQGAIGLISQSRLADGSDDLARAGLRRRLHACVTVGNQADLEICDFIEYFDRGRSDARDLRLRRRAEGRPAFPRAGRRCREAGKPLLAVKAGRSETGSRITQSHTASLAGSLRGVGGRLPRARGVCMLDDPEA